MTLRKARARLCGLMAAVAVLAVVASCGKAPDPIRLRFDTPRVLVYDTSDVDDASDPVLGIGGTLRAEARVKLSVMGGVDAPAAMNGEVNVEASVDRIVVDAPPRSGVAVDTQTKRPLVADRTGANAVTLSLLARPALLAITPTADVRFRPDSQIAMHLTTWAATKPTASQGPIQRIAERLDAGLMVERLLGPVAVLLPKDAGVASGATWTVEPPPIGTSAGPLRATLSVTCRRSGSEAILDAQGAFRADGVAPEGRTADFVRGDVQIAVQIDCLTGTLIAFTQKSHIVVAARSAGAAQAEWKLDRKVLLVK